MASRALCALLAVTALLAGCNGGQKTTASGDTANTTTATTTPESAPPGKAEGGTASGSGQSLKKLGIVDITVGTGPAAADGDTLWMDPAPSPTAKF